MGSGQNHLDLSNAVPRQRLEHSKITGSFFGFNGGKASTEQTTSGVEVIKLRRVDTHGDTHSLGAVNKRLQLWNCHQNRKAANTTAKQHSSLLGS